MFHESNLLQKTVWTYKEVLDDELINENKEIILSFYDHYKYELNLNRYHSEMYMIFLI